MTDRTLIKFIRNELSRKERVGVFQWIEASKDNRTRYHLMKALETTAQFNKPYLDVDKSYQDVVKRTKKPKGFIPVLTRVAAAVLILVTVWLVWEKMTNSKLPQSDNVQVANEITNITGRGENTLVILPDGSTVLLNADSRLTWNADFGDSLREIYLTGEAFFNVVHDTLYPFIVHTGEMDVKVLGTSFNVRAYPNDQKPVTTLVSGSVEITVDVNNTVKLEPLQTAILDLNTEQFEIVDISEDEAAPWREGRLIFKDTPLELVVRDIERKYNVECNVESIELKEFRFTGTFDNLEIGEVLRVLKISSGIDYKMDGQIIELY